MRSAAGGVSRFPILARVPRDSSTRLLASRHSHSSTPNLRSPFKQFHCMHRHAVTCIALLPMRSMLRHHAAPAGERPSGTKRPQPAQAAASNAALSRPSAPRPSSYTSHINPTHLAAHRCGSRSGRRGEKGVYGGCRDGPGCRRCGRHGGQGRVYRPSPLAQIFTNSCVCRPLVDSGGQGTHGWRGWIFLMIAPRPAE